MSQAVPQETKVVREGKRFPLVWLIVGVVVAAAVAGGVVGYLLLRGNTSDAPKGWYGSDSLLINAEVLKHVPEVRYSVGDEHFLIRPQDANNDLTVIRLDVRNRAAAQVFMEVNSDAISLRDRKNQNTEYKPLNPLEQRSTVTDTSTEENKYMPFIWGAVELPQECPDNNQVMQACRLYGWLVFETPKGAKYNQIRWGTGDTVFMNW